MTTITAFTARTDHTFATRPLTPSLDGSTLDAIRETIGAHTVTAVDARVCGEPVTLWLDDEALLTGGPVVNLAATRLLAALLEEGQTLRQPLFGECVITGFNPETGETVALSERAVAELQGLAEVISPSLPVTAE